ncbi:PBP1A family penicillin-binding protein [Enterococcus sp. CWB-B31]|uniref:PBP1A family penicillin-binding protein n=1 Tax=Enterococcus sp. CWB-B31 TaxID=2885159 RepID=UPI001E56F03E|nr:PBP1A family penicillin-binding protein [Enterococcus sp. CWB-B31]MCB5954316.1 PBP1A family penicillin-binding protein [Enterococcus sp. CWB-B31]
MSSEIESRSQKHSSSLFRQKQNKTTAGDGPPKRKKKIFVKILIGLFGLGVLGGLSGLGLFWYYAKDAPALEDSALSDPLSSKLYDINNNVFQDLGSEKRETIQPTEVPQLLKDAIVSVEDKRFYNHNGIDPIRIVGSFFSNVKTGGLQGGSTLTQQLIKLSYFSTKESDQTLKRKAQEAWMAIKLEKEKSKEEILTYYINKVYMANGLYGMQTASETYFGKPLSELNLSQTALLAGMPQAPNDYDPYVHPDLTKERRDVVLYTMRDNDKITQEEYEQAKAAPVEDGLQPQVQSSGDRKIVDNYVTEVIAEVEAKTGKNVYTDGLDIYTNLDMDAQKQLYNIVNTDEFVQYPDEEMQVATTVIDVNTGQVRAQIGRRNVPEDAQQILNLATRTNRDVGSTMKPIADYGPAIEYLDYSTGQIMVDKPTTFAGTTTSVYNADLLYYGSMTMRRAIMTSRNTTAVQTFNEVGSDKVAEFLRGLGIEFNPIVDANAISSNTADTGNDVKYGVSSLKLAAAYAAFANGGTYNEPSYVNKVVYQDDSVAEDEFQPASKRAMKDSTAYMMTDMLKDVITGGTAFNAGIDGLIQAGKTGTSNYTDEEIAKMGLTGVTNIAPDSTFVGYTPHYAISVWTGYDEKSTPIYSDYYAIASDVYREMMTYMAQNVSNEDWVMPDSVIRIGSELYVKGAQNLQTVPSSTIPSSSSSTMESSSTVESSTSSSSSEEPVTPPIESSEVTESSAEPTESSTPTSSTDPAEGENQVPLQPS